MNLPSFDKFINDVQPGGIVLIDSSLIDKKVERTDVTAFYVPATKLADENDLNGLANMILLGKLYQETKFCSPEALEQSILKCVPPRKANLIDANKKAIALGQAQ